MPRGATGSNDRRGIEEPNSLRTIRRSSRVPLGKRHDRDSGMRPPRFRGLDLQEVRRDEQDLSVPHLSGRQFRVRDVDVSLVRSEEPDEEVPDLRGLVRRRTLSKHGGHRDRGGDPWEDTSGRLARALSSPSVFLRGLRVEHRRIPQTFSSPDATNLRPSLVQEESMRTILAMLAILARPALAQEEDLRKEKEVERLRKETARQLEVQTAEREHLEMKLARVTAERDALRDEFLRLGPRVQEAEALAREHKSLLQRPAACTCRPREGKSIQAKITAVSTEHGLVILDAGRAAGVRYGDSLVVSRGRSFVATIRVERVDEKWSSAGVQIQSERPQVGDDVVGPDGPRPPLSPKSADELAAIRKELDELRREIRDLSDERLPSWREFGVAVEELPHELREHLGLQRGLLVRRVKEGSPAVKAGLQRWDVLPDLTPEELFGTLRKGSSIRIIRRGQGR